MLTLISVLVESRIDTIWDDSKHEYENKIYFGNILSITNLKCMNFVKSKFIRKQHHNKRVSGRRKNVIPTYANASHRLFAFFSYNCHVTTIHVYTVTCTVRHFNKNFLYTFRH